MSPDPFHSVLGFRRGPRSVRVQRRPPLTITAHVGNLFRLAADHDIESALSELRDLGPNDWRRPFVSAPIVLATAEVGYDLIITWVQSALGEIGDRLSRDVVPDDLVAVVWRALTEALSEALPQCLPDALSCDSLVLDAAKPAVGGALAVVLERETADAVVHLLDADTLDDALRNSPDLAHLPTKQLAEALARQRTWALKPAFIEALELTPARVEVQIQPPASDVSAYLDWELFSRALINEFAPPPGTSVRHSSAKLGD